MEEINVEKSILKNRLIFKTHWIESFEIFFNLMVFIIFCFLDFLLVFIGKFEFTTFSIILLISINSAIAGQVLLIIIKYSKNDFRKLYHFTTTLDIISCKRLLYNYFIKRNFEYDQDYKAENYFCFNGTKTFSTKGEILVFIFIKNKIIMNLFVTNGRLRFPSKKRALIYEKEINELLQNSDEKL